VYIYFMLVCILKLVVDAHTEQQLLLSAVTRCYYIYRDTRLYSLLVSFLTIDHRNNAVILSGVLTPHTLSYM